MDFEYIFLYENSLCDNGDDRYYYKAKVSELETEVTLEKILSLFHSRPCDREEIGMEPHVYKNNDTVDYAQGWSSTNEDEILTLHTKYKCIAIACFSDE